jgi:hypothetical protein
VTIKVTSHIMKGQQAIHLLVEAANGIVVIVRVDVHKIDCIPHWVKRENQYIAMVNDVSPEGQAKTGKVVVDVSHNARGSPPYHRPYNVQPIRVLRRTNVVVPVRVCH